MFFVPLNVTSLSGMMNPNTKYYFKKLFLKIVELSVYSKFYWITYRLFTLESIEDDCEHFYDFIIDR